MDVQAIANEIQRIETLIATGPLEELIAYAKEYNIHHVTTNRRYNEQVEKIKQRLIAEGVDPETVR